MPADPDPFARVDPTDDRVFYSFERKVTHIEAGAIEALRGFYASIIPPGGRVLVTPTRPASPVGQSPSRSDAPVRSSNTTNQGWLVSPSQLMKRAAIDSAVPVGSMPVAANHPCTSPERTDARLVAEIQMSASTAPDRQSDSAIITAI